MIFLLVIVTYAALLSCGGSDSVMIFLFCQFHSSPLLTIDFRSLLSTGSQCVFFFFQESHRSEGFNLSVDL